MCATFSDDGKHCTHQPRIDRNPTSMRVLFTIQPPAERQVCTSTAEPDMDDNDRNDVSSRERIDLEDADQVRYWTNHMGVTLAQLRDAMRHVGAKVADVRRYLGR